MKILLCIDDIKNSSNKSITEKIARYIVKNIMYNKYGTSEEITRHKLFVNKSITYDSSNTSTCIKADVIEDNYMDVIKDAEDIIKENASEYSNPGICVIMEDKLINKDEIIEYGLKVKSQVVTKTELFSLALRSGIYLKERGGTGIGIIGAFAGAALRLSGNDGEVVEEES
ncbi:hypothetical protein [Clostridium cylindrosporum]|uniref:Uncharacterized protein n=1 Tax=Clostridium cylindrosporum DSM 605 TaxID=1121307 RepID=A0A0J8D9X0_CLOCY|nr:hypothetical protein [Clostridium cylindrosporum]KMT21088.1 hypothetical protein CLCY_1c03220 [Clostridium cylindrosporum DSM 605]